MTYNESKAPTERTVSYLSEGAYFNPAACCEYYEQPFQVLHYTNGYE